MGEMSRVTDEIKMPFVDNFSVWAMDIWGFIIIALFTLLSIENVLQQNIFKRKDKEISHILNLL